MNESERKYWLEQTISDLKNKISLYEIELDGINNPKCLHEGIVYCGKIIYPSKSSAKKAMQKINNLLNDSNRMNIKRFYYCEHCSGWHLTSKPDWILNKRD